MGLRIIHGARKLSQIPRLKKNICGKKNCSARKLAQIPRLSKKKRSPIIIKGKTPFQTVSNSENYKK